MAGTVKSPPELEKMRLAGQLVAEAHRAARELIRPGVSTLSVDEELREFVTSRGGAMLFYRYRGFPANSCISINEEVVHGIPRKRRKLRDGDIVSVDIGVRLQGYCGDSAWTYEVGSVVDDARKLTGIGEEALNRGIDACRAGSRVSDIGRAIQTFVEDAGYYVVKQFVGHGIGTKLHEDPQVPNYVDSGILKRDPVLKPGMVLAIEPMVNASTEDVETLDDGWTVVTKDRGLSVHFEHTVAITEDKPVILTRLS